MNIENKKNTQFKKRRFTYKLHLIIMNEKGDIIKDKKYCTGADCANDNLELLRNRQVVSRIANNYKFTKGFNTYDNVTINKINEKRKTKFVYTRVLNE